MLLKVRTPSVGLHDPAICPVSRPYRRFLNVYLSLPSGGFSVGVHGVSRRSLDLSNFFSASPSQASPHLCLRPPSILYFNSTSVSEGPSVLYFSCIFVSRGPSILKLSCISVFLISPNPPSHIQLHLCYETWYHRDSSDAH